MIKLLEIITTKLKTVHPRVYLEEAPGGTAFPYVTFNLPDTDETSYPRQDIYLEVDVWDHTTDPVTLETITDSIDDALHKYMHYEAGQLSARFYRLNRLMVPDPDPAIRRRQLRYEVKTFDLR